MNIKNIIILIFLKITRQFKLWNIWNKFITKKRFFSCPICGYEGQFYNWYFEGKKMRRINAICPNCGAQERHRMQYLVMNLLLKENNFSEMRMLHFAPEIFFNSHFRLSFKEYITSDKSMNNVDYKLDLIKLPFPDESFDFIFASHVLEHIKDDIKALSEIHRVLKKGGIAVLPVPIISEKTIEYKQPNLYEYGHVRAPGHDYFKKYEFFFSKVRIFKSDEFDEKFQIYIFEDRSIWPNKKFPYRQPMPGNKHLEYVPVCYK